jgi:hypothetical protein
MESVGGGFKPQIDTAGVSKAIQDAVSGAGVDPEAIAAALAKLLKG